MSESARSNTPQNEGSNMPENGVLIVPESEGSNVPGNR